MGFVDAVELYADDMQSLLRENAWRTKEYAINEKLMPFFGIMLMTEVATLDAIKRQSMHGQLAVR